MLVGLRGGWGGGGGGGVVATVLMGPLGNCPLCPLSKKALGMWVYLWKHA